MASGTQVCVEGRGQQPFRNSASYVVFSDFSDERVQRTEADQVKVEGQYMKKFKDVSGPEGFVHTYS